MKVSNKIVRNIVWTNSYFYRDYKQIISDQKDTKVLLVNRFVGFVKNIIVEFFTLI